MPLVGVPQKGSSLPFQARFKAGHQPKSEGAPATEQGRAAEGGEAYTILLDDVFYPSANRIPPWTAGYEEYFTLLILLFKHPLLLFFVLISKRFYFQPLWGV